MSQVESTLFHVAAMLYSYNSKNYKVDKIVKKIIESMLVITENKLHTVTELSVFIEKKMNMTIPNAEIEQIVCDSKNDGFSVDYSGIEIKFCLKNSRYDYIMNMNVKNMNSYIGEFIQLNDYTENEKLILEKYLYDFYRKNFNDLQHVIGNGTDKSMSLNFGEYSEEEYEIIRKFIEWENEGKNEQMLALASYALEYSFVAGETGLKQNTHIENVFSGKNLYIDTNILFYCLGINGETYEEANKMFLRRCKRCNENIVISYYTDAELRKTFAHFEEEINRLNSPLIHNTRISSYFLDDDVYHYYIKWAKDRKRLNDAKFFIRFLYDKYETLIKEFNIKVEKAMPFLEEKLVSDEKIREYESEIVRSSTINYDARNIYFIESKRKVDETNLQEVKDIFISADRSLQNWDMRRGKSVPIVVSPNTWLLLISRLLGRNQDDFKCFISYINQANTEFVINNKEFYEVLKAIYEIVEDVKQQESVVEVMIEEEFAFLNNNGEKRSPEFIREKTQEKTYTILEQKIDTLTHQLEKVTNEVNNTKKISKERDEKNHLEVQSLENELANQSQIHEQEISKIKAESAQKDVSISDLNNKLKCYPKLIAWIGLILIITIPLIVELVDIFIMKEENPISYQIFSFLYEKSIFDDGNKIEVYGQRLLGISGLIITTIDIAIIKQISKLIKKIKE